MNADSLRAVSFHPMSEPVFWHLLIVAGCAVLFAAVLLPVAAWLWRKEGWHIGDY